MLSNLRPKVVIRIGHGFEMVERIYLCERRNAVIQLRKVSRWDGVVLNVSPCEEEAGNMAKKAFIFEIAQPMTLRPAIRKIC